MKWAVVCDAVWMAVYFAGLFLIVPRVGLVGTALAQLAAAAAQAATAVLLARMEGLYPAVGGAALLRALAASLVFAGAGAAACALWGLTAAAACIVLAPFLLKLAVGRLSLFEPDESRTLLGMLRGRPGSRVLRWVLSLEG